MDEGNRVREPVQYDKATNVLTVGVHSVVLEPAMGGDANEVVLHTYLELVARARGVELGPDLYLRHEDIEVLAHVLDLGDAELEARLMRMLRVDAPTAAKVHRRIKRRRLVIAAASVTASLAVVMPFRAHADHTSVSTTGTVNVAPTATSQPVDIGTALVIERGTQPDDPNTQIGDAVTYER